MTEALYQPISPFGAALQSALMCRDKSVLATIVRTSGSTYRKAGAAMLITSDGKASGLLSGGCLESEITQEALALIASEFQSKLLHFDLTPDDDYLIGYGKGCAGKIWILLEILRPGLMLTQHIPSGQSANAIIIETSARIRIDESYKVHYEGHIEPAVAQKIVDTLQSRQVLGKPFFETINTNLSWCGWYSQPPIDLVIIGAGADAIPLCALAADMRWVVRVCDHRPARLTEELFPGASHLIQITPDSPPKLPASMTTHVVIMSHNLIVDSQALVWAAEHHEISYIGLLGPSSRRERIFQILEKDGKNIRQDLERRLRSPIGIDLGGHSETDIALSIITQIQKTYYKATLQDLTC